jgi:hypothetical protein
LEFFYVAKHAADQQVSCRIDLLNVLHIL